nr:hypothetical protein [Tanacetum cinerariifolium]
MLASKIREEFRTSSGPSDSGGNPPPVTINTWLERFNKQKPRSFEKATAPVDAENWISHMEKIFDVMGCEDAFKTRLAVYKFEGNALAWWKSYKQAKCGDERLKREYHSIRQTDTETSTEFMQRFLRLAGFLGAAAGTAEEQAKNFQWGLCRLICVKENQENDKNGIKTGQKQEACRSREKVKAVAVGRARKTEQNAKRMVENAYTVKKLFKYLKIEEKTRA